MHAGGVFPDYEAYQSAIFSHDRFNLQHRELNQTACTLSSAAAMGSFPVKLLQFKF